MHPYGLLPFLDKYPTYRLLYLYLK
jgi:hypothetical protein